MLISLTLVNHALTYLSVEVLSTRRRRFKPVAGNSHSFWQLATLSNVQTHNSGNVTAPDLDLLIISPDALDFTVTVPVTAGGCRLFTDNFFKLNWTLPVQQLSFG